MTFIVQAITTKYIGPSNTRGSRIKAKAATGSITIGCDDSLNIEQRHAKAAEALARKFGWHGNYFQGGSPDECGYCFVCVNASDDADVPAFSIARETNV
jgi:hypothetical protein